MKFGFELKIYGLLYGEVCAIGEQSCSGLRVRVSACLPQKICSSAHRIYIRYLQHPDDRRFHGDSCNTELHAYMTIHDQLYADHVPCTLVLLILMFVCLFWHLQSREWRQQRGSDW